MAKPRGVFSLESYRITLQLSFFSFLCAVPVSAALAQEEPKQLTLSEFLPQPKVAGKAGGLKRASLPVIDVHSHFYNRMKHDRDQLDAFVELMDRNNIAICVSLDGRLGSRLDEHIDYLWKKYENRFAIFTNVDWVGRGSFENPASMDCHQPDFARRTVMQLEEAKRKGVCGLKVFKTFGLYLKNPDGTQVRVDDERFGPIWEACGRLGLPVIMHTADPSAFFDPINPQNERYEELSRHPDWHFPPDRFPSREELHQARENLFKRHRNTTFIAAHFGNDAEDLKETARILDDNPNVVVEFASRISELGRQPYSAREFFLKYQDRILFGTDGPWPELRYEYYWRFLESNDEYFPYSEKPVPPQGLWRIYGIYLPESVLIKIYQQNALRVIPGLQEKLREVAN